MVEHSENDTVKISNDDKFTKIQLVETHRKLIFNPLGECRDE